MGVWRLSHRMQNRFLGLDSAVIAPSQRCPDHREPNGCLSARVFRFLVCSALDQRTRHGDAVLGAQVQRRHPAGRQRLHICALLEQCACDAEGTAGGGDVDGRVALLVDAVDVRPALQQHCCALDGVLPRRQVQRGAGVAGHSVDVGAGGEQRPAHLHVVLEHGKLQRRLLLRLARRQVHVGAGARRQAREDLLRGVAADEGVQLRGVGLRGERVHLRNAHGDGVDDVAVAQPVYVAVADEVGPVHADAEVKLNYGGFDAQLCHRSVTEVVECRVGINANNHIFEACAAHHHLHGACCVGG
eukprot:Rhum_TRINITY_DN18753_c0_g1::Rhum_TRINITY_DN18753_c0_g1_i1::g.168254::m.168254